MEKEIELVFDKLKEAFDWTSETVTQLYPMVLQEYQMYNVFEILKQTFYFAPTFFAISGCIGGLIFMYGIDSKNEKAKKTGVLTAKISIVLLIISIPLYAAFNILQIYLAPHYHMFTQLM